MSESSRSLPDQPSLRFLKLEARRRLAAGEFRALHEAQLAIAREHGFSSCGRARGAAASLVVKLDSGKAYVALTNRGIPIEEVNGRVVRALADS